MPGPNLAGLIGRKVAGDEKFDYSPVLQQAREQGRVWTVEALEMFLADPEAMFPRDVDECAGHPRHGRAESARAVYRRSDVAVVGEIATAGNPAT
jgi:cytochrome c2